MERALCELTAALKAWDSLPVGTSQKIEALHERRYYRAYDQVRRGEIASEKDALATVDYFLDERNVGDPVAPKMLRRAVHLLLARRAPRARAGSKNR
jgi:hypothetical protein